MTVDLVRELRDRTGAGIMDCKAALQASQNDLEKAIDVIRKKGAAASAKRAGREAREGMVAARIEGAKAAIVESNCETDFVARTEDFKALTILALDEAFRSGEGAIGGDKVQARVSELTGKIGEKILVRRARVLEARGGAFFSYIHANQKIGVLVELGFTKPGAEKSPVLAELGRNIAMQIAASNPICVNRAEVPAATIDRECAIFREEAKGKPENILEKIVQGKFEKFYQTNCLVEQFFIKDDKRSIKQVVAEAGKSLGDTVEVRRFVRFQLGELAQAS